MLGFFVATMLAGGGTLPQAHGAAAILVSRAQSPSATRGAFSRAADGLFYVTGTINGAPVRFLVDTGSTSTVLTRDDARRAGVMPALHQFNAQADTANGQARIAWVEIDDLQVGGIRARSVMAAVAGGGLGVSLLGQNMLSQLGSLTIAGDRMEFR